MSPKCKKLKFLIRSCLVELSATILGAITQCMPTPSPEGVLLDGAQFVDSLQKVRWTRNWGLSLDRTCKHSCSVKAPAFSIHLRYARGKTPKFVAQQIIRRLMTLDR